MRNKTFLFDDSLADITSNKSNALEVSVYYSLGGLNYWNYKQEGRGFYVAVKSVKKDDISVSFMVGGDKNAADGKLLVKELKRNNKKKLNELAERVLDYAQANKEYFLEVYKAGRADLMINLILAATGSEKAKEAA